MDKRFADLLKERENMLMPKELKIENVLDELDGYNEVDNNFMTYLNNIDRLKNELKNMKNELTKIHKQEKEFNELYAIIEKFRGDFKKKTEKLSKDINSESLSTILNKIKNNKFENELEEHIKGIKKINMDKQEKFQLLYTKYKNMINKIGNILSNENLEDEIMNNETSCPICYDNKVSHCINPCGHTFCGDCIKNLHGECFMCRIKIKNVIKMFIAFNDGEKENIENNEPIASNDIPIIQPYPLNTNPQEEQDIQYFTPNNNLEITLLNNYQPPP